MRCPSCNKFVPFDTEVDPEEEDEPSIDDNNHFHASYTRTLTCEECGDDLKSALIEIDEDLSDIPDCSTEEGHAWDFDKVSVSPSTRYEGKGRGTRTFYGVEVSGEAKCSHCNHTMKIEASND